MKPRQKIAAIRSLQRKRIARRMRVAEEKRREQARCRTEAEAPGPVDALEDVVTAAIERVTRRRFLQRAGGAGLAAGLSPLMTSCGSDRDPEPAAPAGKEARTLFFNLAHEDYAGRTYTLTGGGRTYVLTPVAARPDVLARERAGNQFLRNVPDDQITHHVEDVVTPGDTVTLFYVSSDLDPVAGTWSMSSTHLQIPMSASPHAYRLARMRFPSGPLPLSAKRKLYGMPGAQTEQDMREERVLVDAASHAATLVGMHPDLLSLDANSANNIHSNHIDTSIDVVLLAELLRRSQFATANPQLVHDTPNPTGWGTLVPVMNTGPTGIAGPVKNVNGTHRGRIQYQPILHPMVASRVGPATGSLTPAVKNDASLIGDVTGVDPTNPGTPPAGSNWYRHDGATNVDQSPGKAVGDANVVMTLKQPGPQNGLQLFTSVSQSGSGAPVVSLTMLNWYVRFLGVYLQFLDDKEPPNVLALASIPEYAAGTIISGHDANDSMDTDTGMFVTVLSPIFTILGIPTVPGFVQPSFTVPQSAHTVRILSSGLSFGTSNPYPETVLAGAIMTGIINYGVTALLAAAGAAAGLSLLMKVVVVPFVSALARELVVAITEAINDKGIFTAAFWEAQGLATAKYLLGFGVGKAVGALVSYIVGDITVSVLEDSIPVAGLIMLAISVAAGLANILETSIELAYSPWTYVDDLVFTHDLSVTLQPDPNDQTFPKAADHYKVTALFDDGTPHVQVMPLTSFVPPLPPVKFSAVPLGGQVNVSVSFYQAGTATTVDTLLGKGTTGRVANDVATPVPPLPIQELKFPIGPATTYRHRQKTTVDPGTGNHVWSTTAPPPTQNASNPLCGGAGTICGYRGITVRQGTSVPPREGYVGYAWQSANSDPKKAPSCFGNGSGQLDQIANLDTANAATGYAVTSCGISQPGVRVAYNLLSHGSANFYLDSTNPNAPIVRQITLEPAPAFDGPASNRAWGVFNFLPDVLLLHPAGHLVSINSAVHKMETHRIPPTFKTDAAAQVSLVAQVKCGQGTLPGLMTSPVGAAVTADGTILVVEAGDVQAKTPVPNRIQALDIGGNPVRYFTGQASPYFLSLTETSNLAGWRHLDIAAEFGGLVYLLSYNINSYVYRLDIYHPAQTGSIPISTTSNINAARLAVDFWRNVYTLNYEVLPLAAPGLTEPTVSLWVPTQSCTGAGCTPS